MLGISVFEKTYTDKVLLLEGVLCMRKVSFRIRNFDEERFLTFNIDNEAGLDEELLDFIEDEEPNGIVPVIFEEGEEFDTFSYDITDRIQLKELFEQVINAEMVLKVLRGLVLTLIDMAECRIPLSYLVLNRNYIYIDSDYKLDFICIPLEEMQEEVDLNGFLRNFLASLRFEPSENGDYVAKLLTYVNNPVVFNLHNMVVLIEGLMSDRGIEIPEDDSVEIYAEYHEVEEKPEDSPEEEDIVKEDTKPFDDDIITVFGSDIQKQKMADGWEDTEIESDMPAMEVELPEESGEENLRNETEKAEIVEESIEEIPENSMEGEILEEEIFEKSAEAETPEEEVWKPGIPEEGIVEEIPKESIEEGITEEFEEKPEEIVQAKEPEVLKKKPVKETRFKTKETNVKGIVIEDDFDEFLAEQEMKNDKPFHFDERGLKIKKNIKINRASIVQNTREDLTEEIKKEEKASDGVIEEEDVKKTEDNPDRNRKKGSNGKKKIIPKIHPYLIRTNTRDRMMIGKQNFKIGKSNLADYTVEGNNAVSRVHAIITNKDGEYFIKDNKSTNHTYVNGKMLQDDESELLAHDSKIVLGDEEFEFKMH